MNETMKSQDLSPEVKKILQEESEEAEIDAAVDAAREEGIEVTEAEVRDILKSVEKNTD